jgi:hypothetical protein
METGYIQKYCYCAKVFKVVCMGCAIIWPILGCNNNASSSNQSNVDSVRQDKTQVHADTAEIFSFRRNEEELIRKNNENIAELKEKIRKDKTTIATTYNTQLDTLEAENSRMEQKLSKFGESTKADWESFKHDFNRNMDSIGKSISRFAEKNMSKERSDK